jgi:branched-chain amino acid transport system substrate-binding protein
LGNVAHKIGVVVPTSRHLPQLGSDFVTGLRMALAGAATQALGPVALVLAEYDGARPAMGLQQIQTLAARDDLTMLTAFVEPDRAQGLQAVLAKNEMPLLVCEVGANVSRLAANSAVSSVQTSFNSHVAVQSLGAWQSNHRAGAWAAKQLGKRGVQAMGWRESGYDLPYAFRHGFEGAGGEVLGQHVSFQPTQSQPAKGQPTQAQAFAGLAGLVRSTRPDFVHALYSGSDATAFATFYHQAGLDLIAPLVGGGFLTAASVANGGARVPLRGAPLLTAASWAPALLQCTAFGESCQRVGQAASPLAMLGYEAGLRILSGLQTSPGGGVALAQTLSGAVSSTQNATSRPTQAHWLRAGWDESVAADLAPTDGVGTSGPRSLRGLQTGWIYAYLSA